MAAVYEVMAASNGLTPSSAEVLPFHRDAKPDLERVIRELEKGWVEERLVLETEPGKFDAMLAEIAKTAPQIERDRGLEMN